MTIHYDLLQANEATLLRRWIDRLQQVNARANQVLTESERGRYSQRVLTELIKGMAKGEVDDFEGAPFADLRTVLADISAAFAERGLTPTETATYIFSLKEVFFGLYAEHLKGEELVKASWDAGLLVDRMGLLTFEAFTTARERIIKSQAQALADLSTPVIKVWDGIIALPLVGTIDSMRAKEIMEKLLEAVVSHDADIAIIDITGVPVVDTQVANRLMRTVESVRLLGTKSVVTGINPIIAQTLVQLGVDLSQLTTKASLHAGLAQAFRELRLRVTPAEARS